MRHLAFALLLACIGCTSAANDKQPSVSLREVDIPNKIDIPKATDTKRRFLPTNSADLAFDTETGSLCKTWAWGAGLAYSNADTLAKQDTCATIYYREWEREDRMRREESKGR